MQRPILNHIVRAARVHPTNQWLAPYRWVRRSLSFFDCTPRFNDSSDISAINKDGDYSGEQLRDWILAAVAVVSPFSSEVLSHSHEAEHVHAPVRVL